MVGRPLALDEDHMALQAETARARHPACHVEHAVERRLSGVDGELVHQAGHECALGWGHRQCVAAVQTDAALVVDEFRLAVEPDEA